MRNLKRDNWTNEEVIDIIEGLKIDLPKNADASLVSFNQGLDMAVQEFHDFKRSTDDMGAKAYCTDDKFIYHVGRMPPK